MNSTFTCDQYIGEVYFEGLRNNISITPNNIIYANSAKFT